MRPQTELHAVWIGCISGLDPVILNVKCGRFMKMLNEIKLADIVLKRSIHDQNKQNRDQKADRYRQKEIAAQLIDPQEQSTPSW
jgi:hypothetical protein